MHKTHGCTSGFSKRPVWSINPLIIQQLQPDKDGHFQALRSIFQMLSHLSRVRGVNLICEEKICQFHSKPDQPAMLGAAPPTWSLFLTVCAGTCTRVASWRSHFFSICGTGDALAGRPCTDEQTVVLASFLVSPPRF